MTELERMCVEFERHMGRVETELVHTMAAFRTVLRSLTEVVKERDDLWLALQNAKGDRDAALKLVDDTLEAVGGEPLPEMGQPEYAQPDPPSPPNPPAAPAHAEDRAPW